MSLFFFDIEANDLLYGASHIWCLVGYEDDTSTYHIWIDSKEKFKYNNTIFYVSIEELLEEMKSHTLVGHNILGYDLPLLYKLYSIIYSTIEDTIVLSRLSYPDREGHSLEDWGEKLRFKKGNHKDFSKFSKEMLDYCIRDVDLTRKVYYVLMEEMKGWDWEEAKKIEYAMQVLATKQETTGILFDVEKAKQLLNVIEEEIESIEAIVIPSIPNTVEDLGMVNKPFLKSGELSEQSKRWLNEMV
jgi:DNA polymerase I-like protein with 3'-5' exonuclease and polymerase domains